MLVPFAKDYDNIQNIVMTKYVPSTKSRRDRNLTSCSFTSYIGAYLLTRLLLPLLKRTAQEPNSDVRIVFVRPLPFPGSQTNPNRH